jgi:hypothetical protein
MPPNVLGNCPERPAWLGWLGQLADLCIALVPVGVARGRLVGRGEGCARLGRWGRRRRLDTRGLGRERQGASRRRPMERL